MWACCSEVFTKLELKQAVKGKAVPTEIIKREGMPPSECCSVIAIKSVHVFTKHLNVSFLQSFSYVLIFASCEQPPVPTGLCTAQYLGDQFLVGLRPCWVFSVLMHMYLFLNWKHLLFPGLSWQPVRKAVCFMFISPGRSPALVSLFVICQERQQKVATIFHSFLIT